MDEQKLCRTYLGTEGKMSSIFVKVQFSSKEVSFSDILLKFYKYKVEYDDGLPQNICDLCIYQLTITYSFKRLIEHNARKLLEWKPLIVNDNDILYDSDIDMREETEAFLTEDKNYKPDRIIKTNKQNERKMYLYCAKCKSEFSSIKSLQIHCKQHSVENSEGRECEYCNEKFDSFRSLIAHRKQHFSLLVCETCWKGFNSMDDYSTHECKEATIEENDPPEPVTEYQQCDQCGKSYPSSYIKLHMLIHGEKRAYSCSYCPKKFKVRCSLNSHVLWMHKRTRKHQCSVCDATFISASARSAHYRKYHLNERKHSCETCGKSFFSRSDLKCHLLTHTGVKNFHCHLCTKSYQTRHGLNVHLRSHNEDSDASLEN